MKINVSPALAAFLDRLCTSGVGGSYTVTDLYTISLLGGEVMYLASYPLPVVCNGITYAAAQGYVDRSVIRQALKCEVSQIKLTLRASPAMVLPGSTMPVLQAVEQGLFAMAYVRVDRLFSATANPLDTSLGTVNWFTGNIAEVEELDRAHAVFSVKDPTAYLSSQHPRNQLTTGCRHTLFDYGCALNAVSYLASGTVLAGATATVIPTSLSNSTYPTTVPTPVVAPTVGETGDQNGVNNPAATYSVVITLVGPAGESMASPEATYAVTGGGAAGTTAKLFYVVPPSSVAGATGWNCYVGLSAGNEQLQNGAPLAFGGPDFIVNYPPYQGAAPPFQTANGWFAGGQVVFTSGSNKGLTRAISVHVSGVGGGVLTVLPPLPNVPAPGDAFNALPGCSKTACECAVKFNNLVHLGAVPFTPLPEQSV